MKLTIPTTTPALAGVELVVDPALPADTIVARAGDRLYLGKVTPEGVRVVELPRLPDLAPAPTEIRLETPSLDWARPWFPAWALLRR